MKGAHFGGVGSPKMGLDFSHFPRYTLKSLYYTHRKEKNMEKIDTISEIKKEYSKNNTHFPFDFVVCFCSGSDTVARTKVNARDSIQALFLSIRALCRKGSRYNITRVRIGGKYPAGKKQIETGIG